MKQLFKPYLIFAIAALMSSGAVVSAFLEIGDTRGFNVFFVSLPRMVLLILLCAFTLYFANPKLLLRGKYIPYAIQISLLSLVTTIISVVFEHQLKINLDAGLKSFSFSSVYIWAYIISNSVLIAILMFGLGGITLYKKWNTQLVIENQLYECYIENIKIFRSRFDTEYLLELMDDVIHSMKKNSNAAQRKIELLSDYLRYQLYETSPIRNVSYSSESLKEEIVFLNILIAPQYRFLRWAILEILIILVSMGAFFPCFQLNMTINNIVGALLSILLLNLIICVNVRIIFPFYKRRESITGYLICVSIPVIIIGCISLIANFISFSSICSPNFLVMSIAIISSFGTTIAVGLFWVGTSGFLCFQYWLITDRKIAHLKVENRKLEYSLLQRQLSPHFLFNVLNNIDFLFDEDENRAIKLMIDFKNLMEYQLCESQKELTSIQCEIDFLNSYLSLEKIRHDVFDYNIEDYCSRNYCIPTLLFIPFVENAVKYSKNVNNERAITIVISDFDGVIRFCCRNTFMTSTETESRPGGIGLSNTERRLRLLFGQDYSLNQSYGANNFTVQLDFPIKQNEVHNNR